MRSARDEWLTDLEEARANASILVWQAVRLVMLQGAIAGFLRIVFG